MDFNEYKNFINEVDSIISCTSSPHIVIKKNYINDYGNDILLIDLALPRDIDEQTSKISRVTLLDIDEISKLDLGNKNLRKLEMNKNKYIVNEYLNDFINWMKLREITYYIKKIRNTEEVIIKERSKSFEHKCKNKEDIMLANKLIKSTADYYVNKAISVLKEEKLKGREEECLEILQKIFMET